MAVLFIWYNGSVEPTDNTVPTSPPVNPPNIGALGPPNDTLDLPAPPLPGVSPALPAIQTPGLPTNAAPVIPTAAETTLKAPSAPLVTPPATADDDDLIEQEWVDKAKAIVERTREDPHLQNEELSKFKADYMQKRYNRQIKITEE